MLSKREQSRKIDVLHQFPGSCRNRYSHFLLHIWFPLFLLLMPAFVTAAGSAMPQIIVLNSYHRGFVWSDTEEAGFLRRFHDVYPMADVPIEYLDAKRYPDQDHLAQMKDYLIHKYRGRKIDLVVAFDNPALEMVMRFRNELFTGVPIVFAGVSNFEPSMVAGRKGVTGVPEKMDVKSTLTTALTLHPRTREVLVVNDNTVSGIAARREVESFLPSFGKGVTISLLPPSTFEEVKARIDSLPADAIVIIHSFSTDRSGRTLPLSESTRIMTSSSRVPAYGVQESRLGYGIVGGYLLDGKEHGRQAADIALRVAAGEDPAAIPVDTKSNAKPMFDYRQLREFGISLEKLPANSIVVNRPESIFDRYRNLVIGTIVLLAILIFLVILLTNSIVRHRRAKEELARRTGELEKEVAVRKQAEEQLINSEQSLRAILYTSPIGIGRVRDRAYEWANEAMCRISGYTLDELCNRSTRFLYENDEEFDRVGRVLYDQGWVETKLVRKDGRIRDILLQVSQTSSHSHIFTVSDITELRQAEKALVESEQRFHMLFESAGDAIMILKDNVFTDCNERALAMLGCTREQFLGQSPLAFSPLFQPDGTDSRERMMEKMSACLTEGPQFFEWQSVRRDGTPFDLEISVNCLEVRGETFLQAIARDVTDRKRTEEELRRLSFAIEQAVEDIMITDPEGNIEYVNPAFEKITGYSRQEAIGQNPRFLKSGVHDATFCESLWKTITGGMAWTGRFTNKRKDGAFIQEDATISPLTNSSGRITGYISLKKDVTEEVKLESQLRQAQKVEIIGQMAGGVAHDFNNILSAIMGHGSLLQMKMGEGDQILRPHVEQILLASEKAANLTQSLLAFSRKQIINPKPVSVNDTIINMRKLLSRLITEDIELTTDLTDEKLVIMADVSQIDQILMNLVTNARDAMERGGAIAIKTVRADIDLDFVRDHGYGEPGPYALITVSDTGAGMDEATIEKIFEPFFTTKDVGKGTGLGLAIVYGIVKQHNGYINVSSEPGRGATFHIYIPLIDGDVDDRSTEVQGAPTGTETILVAEDSTELREIMRTVLERQGYTVITAVNGLDAVEKFLAHNVDMVIIDVVMPKMNGMEVYREMKKVNAHTRILFTSGYTEDIVHAKGIGDENVHFMAKPLSPGKFLAKVRGVLDGRE
jgi:PAS domain S-box-containing protein